MPKSHRVPHRQGSPWDITRRWGELTTCALTFPDEAWLLSTAVQRPLVNQWVWVQLYSTCTAVPSTQACAIWHNSTQIGAVVAGGDAENPGDAHTNQGDTWTHRDGLWRTRARRGASWDWLVGLDTQGQARRGTRSLTLTHRGVRGGGGRGMRSCGCTASET